MAFRCLPRARFILGNQRVSLGALRCLFLRRPKKNAGRTVAVSFETGLPGARDQISVRSRRATRRPRLPHRQCLPSQVGESGASPLRCCHTAPRSSCARHVRPDAPNRRAASGAGDAGCRSGSCRQSLAVHFGSGAYVVRYRLHIRAPHALSAFLYPRWFGGAQDRPRKTSVQP